MDDNQIWMHGSFQLPHLIIRNHMASNPWFEAKDLPWDSEMQWKFQDSSLPPGEGKGRTSSLEQKTSSWTFCASSVSIKFCSEKQISLDTFIPVVQTGLLCAWQPVKNSFSKTSAKYPPVMRWIITTVNHKSPDHIQRLEYACIHSSHPTDRSALSYLTLLIIGLARASHDHLQGIFCWFPGF